MTTGRCGEHLRAAPARPSSGRVGGLEPTRPRGMKNGVHSPKVKLGVSMSPELIEKVKAVVAHKRARSVSAYVEHAVAAQLAAEADFDLLIAEELDETGGPPTPEDLRALAPGLRIHPV